MKVRDATGLADEAAALIDRIEDVLGTEDVR
jgi:hypothetical protein